MPRGFVGDKLGKYTLLVGPRFRWSQDERIDDVFRGGAGFTLVIDRIPVSGPVFLIESDDGTKAAQCHNCGEQIINCKGVELPRRWAHEHRCQPKNVERRFREHTYGRRRVGGSDGDPQPIAQGSEAGDGLVPPQRPGADGTLAQKHVPALPRKKVAT